MPEYIEEKTKGEYKAADVTCISLEDIHNMDIDKIEAQLMEVTGFNKVIVNGKSSALFKKWTHNFPIDRLSCIFLIIRF